MSLFVWDAGVFFCVNLNFIVGRGEEVGLDPMYDSRFQWLTARAVSAIGNLERWTRDLRKKEATLIAFKGGSLENEEVTPNQLQNVANLIEHPIKLNGYSDFYFGEKKYFYLWDSNPKHTLLQIDVELIVLPTIKFIGRFS